MNSTQKKIAIIGGVAALGLLAFAGTAGAAVKQPEPGEDGGDTEGNGEAPIDLPPPPPVPPAAPVGPPPFSNDIALLDGYFVNGAGIARALYMLGFGQVAADMAAQLNTEAMDADLDDDLPFVLAFQKAYNKLSAAGRAGKGDDNYGKPLGTIPGDLGELATDGTMGYRTLGALYSALLYFANTTAGDKWAETTAKVKGTMPITGRGDMGSFVTTL